jgi:hypothetical protein
MTAEYSPTGMGSNSSLSPDDQWKLIRAASEAAKDLEGKQGKEAWGQSLPPLPTEQLTDIGKRLLADARRAKGKAAKRDNLFPERRGLDPAIKSRMIELFAHFQGVSQVADTIKREYGLAIDRRTVEGFNPDSPRAKVGKRLRSLFDQHRKAYVEAVAKQGVAHQAHRLKLIGDLVEKASNSKDFNAALRGLELAAKEMGAGQTTTVKHEGVISHVHGSIEDAKAELAMRLAAFVEQRARDEGALLEAVPVPMDEGNRD